MDSPQNKWLILNKLFKLSAIWLIVYVFFAYVSLMPIEESHSNIFDTLLFYAVPFISFWIVWFVSSFWRDLYISKYGYNFWVALTSRLSLALLFFIFLIFVKVTDPENFILVGIFLIAIIFLILAALAGAIEQRHRLLRSQ